ncbi:hypothetical protein [Pararhizobium mangrovi]|uniref:Uncharacterized protein n=1 Tax=Pararhizobium mangrovi TaxID=2590452 RepID=A0A506UE67_9HYPH|nr:hypothetical protein [Pararhizobium mangrovi]TPW31908.1 hypothetical protein FJU11_02825 [Pararhizobium mangrovi]
MTSRKPISTAPTDGTRVTVYWTDHNGTLNESLAHYRSLNRLEKAGGDWSAADEGWWTFVDNDTQKRIHPEEWRPDGTVDDDA